MTGGIDLGTEGWRRAKGRKQTEPCTHIKTNWNHRILSLWAALEAEGLNLDGPKVPEAAFGRGTSTGRSFGP